MNMLLHFLLYTFQIGSPLFRDASTSKPIFCAVYGKCLTMRHPNLSFLFCVFSIIFSLLCFYIPVNAQDHALSDFRLSGFGTVAVSVDDKDEMAFFRDISQDSFEGDRESKNETDFYWKLDSRIGLQGAYRFSDTMEMVVQGVLRHQVDLDFESIIETGFIGFHPTPTLDIRVGRIGYDAFLMSDTRNIGYAYLWARPPVEFYGWIPIFSVDGIDAAWHIHQNHVQWCLKAQGGATRFDVGETGYELKTSNLWSLTLTRIAGPLQLKIGYSHATLDNEIDSYSPLLAGLDTIAAGTSHLFPEISREAVDLRSELSFEGVSLSYITLGMMYDSTKWVVQAELARAGGSIESIPKSDIGYVGIGRRMGDVTPYALFGLARAVNDVRHPQNDWSILGPMALLAQNEAIDTLTSTRVEQHTVSLGVRWDFHNQAALKLQWDRTHVQSQGAALWWPASELSHHSNRINLGTMSIEFIF